MATSVLLNGITYSIPAVGESGWGTNVSSYLVALSTGVLSKAGGTFTLLADVDFGTDFGLKAKYYKSRGTVSTTGIFRLANTEAISWRDQANATDLALSVNASDQLEFAGNPVLTIALGSADTVFRMNSGGTAFEFAKLVDANIDAAAALTLTKLATVTASRALVSDGSGYISAATTTSTQIGYLSAATGTTGTTSTNLVFSTSPTLVTPILGVASATSINKVTITAPATSATLTIADGKTLTASNTLTFTGTDSTSFAFPSGSSTVMTLASTGTVTGAKTYAQAAFLLQDNSTNAVTFQASNSTTSHTLRLPATQGAASTVLTNDGSGNLTWAASVSAALNQYNTYVGNSSNVATAVDTNLLGNIRGLTQSATVTVTIATPGVVSYTSHGLNTGDKFYFTTTGALPTGLTASTTYFVIGVDANSFRLATTLANAHAGTAINTTGSQSGTHTGFAGGLRFLSEDARIPGKTSGNNDTAGYVGEMSRSTVTSATASGVTANQFGNITSLTLTKGHWLVYGHLRNTRVSGQAEITVAISTNSGNTTSDHISGYTEITASAPTVGAGNSVLTLLPWDQSLLTSTTYYLKAKLDAGTWSQAAFVGTIFAIRVS